jgi:hypothetical protein
MNSPQRELFRSMQTAHHKTERVLLVSAMPLRRRAGRFNCDRRCLALFGVKQIGSTQASEGLDRSLLGETGIALLS